MAISLTESISTRFLSSPEAETSPFLLSSLPILKTSMTSPLSDIMQKEIPVVPWSIPINTMIITKINSRISQSDCSLFLSSEPIVYLSAQCGSSILVTQSKLICLGIENPQPYLKNLSSISKVRNSTDSQSTTLLNSCSRILVFITQITHHYFEFFIIRLRFSQCYTPSEVGISTIVIICHFPIVFRHSGFCFLGILCPEVNSDFLTVTLPHKFADNSGFTRFIFCQIRHLGLGSLITPTRLWVMTYIHAHPICMTYVHQR